MVLTTLFQLHQLFNLAHAFRIAVQKDRPVDYILKVCTKKKLNDVSETIINA